MSHELGYTADKKRVMQRGPATMGKTETESSREELISGSESPTEEECNENFRKKGKRSKGKFMITWNKEHAMAISTGLPTQLVTRPSFLHSLFFSFSLSLFLDASSHL